MPARKWRIQRAEIVTEFGVKEAAARLRFVGPGDGMIRSHRFATPRLEVITHRLVRRLVDTKQDGEPRQARDRMVVIRPVGFVPELCWLSLDGGMIFRGG